MELNPSEVHVWLVPLECPAPVLQRRAAHLAPDERERARRLLDDTARRHFVAARGAMRELLGRYLGADPAAVQLVRSGAGKPCLPAPAPLHFNASHAAGLAAVAVSHEEIGIDIERVRPVPRLERIAHRVFTGPELAEWERLGGEEAERAFFRLWTRMEAHAKWRGGGVWRLLADRESAGTPHLHDLGLPSGFVGALAIGGAATLAIHSY
jgi:4'-phosphopantetheinyl transferase